MEDNITDRQILASFYSRRNKLDQMISSMETLMGIDESPYTPPYALTTSGTARRGRPPGVKTTPVAKKPANSNRGDKMRAAWALRRANGTATRKKVITAPEPIAEAPAEVKVPEVSQEPIAMEPVETVQPTPTSHKAKPGRKQQLEVAMAAGGNEAQ